MNVNVTQLAALEGIDVVIGFFHAVRWTEPLVLGLLALHTVLLAVVVALRRVFAVQAFVFAAICGLVYLSEWLNTQARLRWRSIATQNYFDPRGVFAGAMFSGPLLLIGFVQLGLTLAQASSLLVAVKRQEVRAEARKRAEDSKKRR